MLQATEYEWKKELSSSPGQFHLEPSCRSREVSSQKGTPACEGGSLCLKLQTRKCGIEGNDASENYDDDNAVTDMGVIIMILDMND